mmetsp:Transcript_96749/g.243928  ORF Transcript_96749/g.243928 Transcript_96749/m.243928 type:complete len:226 (-) Transcript_96749:7-684(-)
MASVTDLSSNGEEGAESALECSSSTSTATLGKPTASLREAIQQAGLPLQSLCFDYSLGTAGHPHLCGAPCKEFRQIDSCSMGLSCLKCHKCQYMSAVDKRNQEMLADMDFGLRLEVCLPILKEKARSLDCDEQLVRDFIGLLEEEQKSWDASGRQELGRTFTHREKQNLRRILNKLNFGTICRWTVLSKHLRSKAISTSARIDEIRAKYWELTMALSMYHSIFTL